MRKILLTGGGTAGHVMPNIALLPGLEELGYEVHYAGSESGIEKDIIEKIGLKYHAVSSGKLRRYFSLKNFTDAFRVVKGLKDASRLVKRLRPDVCFSKGGFVTVPIVIACWLNKVPVIIHESDMTVGLANKIALKFARRVCVAFPETLSAVSKKRAVHTGTPIRKELFRGDRSKGAEVCGFKATKPVVLVMGGSLGSVKLNGSLRQALPNILKNFNVVHLCGTGNVDNESQYEGYVQFEYLSNDLPHVLDLADVVISRAGANAINEFLALRKPALLVPLSKKASRGDQILNAASFENQGFAQVIQEDEATPELLARSICEIYNNRGTYISAMQKSVSTNSEELILGIIKEEICSEK